MLISELGLYFTINRLIVEKETYKINMNTTQSFNALYEKPKGQTSV